MRASLAIALVLPVMLTGCPVLLSDWTLSRKSAGDAGLDAQGNGGGAFSGGGGASSGGNGAGGADASVGGNSDGVGGADASVGGSSGGADASVGGSNGDMGDGSSGGSSGSGGASGAGGSGGLNGSGGSPGWCANDLNNIHAGDFHISFDVLGAATGGPLLEQRSVCDPYSVDWLIAEQDMHNIVVQLSDGNYANLESIATINDGVWHHVVVARVSGTLSITIDGQLDNSIPNATSLSTLALLQVGKSACATPFAGQVKNVCVTRQ